MNQKNVKIAETRFTRN